MFRDPANPEADTETGPDFGPTPRARVRRGKMFARYDEASVFAVLDAGVMAHVAYVVDGQPFAMPTAYWREGRKLYWHGGASNGMVNAVGEGLPVCVTVSFLDGFVVGQSGIRHSLNFRSVMAFGRAQAVTDLAHKREAMNAFVDRLYAGRAVKLRPSTDAELSRISLVEMEIEDASAKIKNTTAAELAAEEGWSAWTGVFPVETRIGAALPMPGTGAPTSDLAPYREGARLDDTLAASTYGLPVST